MKELLQKYGITNAGDVKGIREELEVRQLQCLNKKNALEPGLEHAELQREYDELEKILEILPKDDEEIEDYVSQGFAYEYGLDVEENYIEAVKCYQQAVEYGSREGCIKLAHMYEWGHGVEMDLDHAHRLYEKAIEMGSDFAKRKLEQLEKRSVKEQEDIIVNRYFEALYLLIKGEKEAAVDLLKELESLGNDMAKEKLLELGCSAKKETVEMPNPVISKPVEEVNQKESVPVSPVLPKPVTEMQQVISSNDEETLQYKETAGQALQKMLSKGRSQQVKAMESSLRVKKVLNCPVVYTTADVFYEHREIYETREASSYVESTSGQIKNRMDYDLWQISDCVTPANLFAEQHNDVLIANSLYLEGCPTCGTIGTVPCTHCSNGTEICPNCNGSGSLRCGSCGGRGEVNCSSCYGRGYHEEEEIVGHDQYNSPIYERVKKTCYTCGGSGTETCGNCGGYGNVTCGSCSGDGTIICRSCRGTMKVTCSSCSGYGHFLNAVRIKQDFNTAYCFEIITPYQIEQSTYKNRTFEEFMPNGRDICLSTLTDTAFIPRTECLSVFSGGSYDISGLMKETENRALKQENTLALNYRSKVYQRDVLDITYEFNAREYRALLDTVTGEILVDVNPYEHVADSMIDEMQSLIARGYYKSFLDSYKEFEAITDSKDVNHDMSDVQSMYKSLEKRFVKISAIVTGVITGLPIVLFLLAGWFSIMTVLNAAAGIALPIFLTKKFWTKAAQDKEKKTEIIIGLVNALIAIMANMIF